MTHIYKNKTTLINELISKSDVVLDVGFWGQGVSHTSSNWVHAILKDRAREVYGIDVSFDESVLTPIHHYQKGSAEHIDFGKLTFDVIFAGDLIEHLSNPGFFLDAARKKLSPHGRLIMTTPNCFNLFNIAEKFSKGEPTVNYDHTCYFNSKTMRQLLLKHGFSQVSFSYIYSLDLTHKESIKKKILNVVYRCLSWFTPKYVETLVVVATP